MRACLFLAGAAVGIVSGPIGTEAKSPPKPSDLIETYDTMDQLCGETGSPVAAATACQERDKLYVTIKGQGWCKGRVGQESADHKWHVCGRGSL